MPRIGSEEHCVQEFVDDNLKWLDKFADMFERMIKTGCDGTVPRLMESIEWMRIALSCSWLCFISIDLQIFRLF